MEQLASQRTVPTKKSHLKQGSKRAGFVPSWLKSKTHHLVQSHTLSELPQPVKPRRIIQAMATDDKTPEPVSKALKETLSKAHSHQALLLTSNYCQNSFVKSINKSHRSSRHQSDLDATQPVFHYVRVFDNDKKAKKLLQSLNYVRRDDIKPHKQDIITSEAHKVATPKTKLMTLMQNASGVQVAYRKQQPGSSVQQDQPNWSPKQRLRHTASQRLFNSRREIQNENTRLLTGLINPRHTIDFGKLKQDYRKHKSRVHQLEKYHNSQRCQSFQKPSTIAVSSKRGYSRDLAVRVPQTLQGEEPARPQSVPLLMKLQNSSQYQF